MFPDSSIEIQNQILSVVVKPTGIPFSLHYKSDRVPSRLAAYTIDIPITGKTLPKALKRIDLDLQIAGQHIRKSFAPEPNQIYTFTWDGKDRAGKPLNGEQSLKIRTSYIYPAPKLPRSQERTTTLGTWQASALGLGGWTISNYHSYDPASKILYLGNGQHRTDIEAHGQEKLTIASTQGGLLYYFDSQGHHLRTINTLTSQILYIFDYDDMGLLRAIQDSDGNITQIQRDGVMPIALISPYDQRCSLTLNSNGYLDSITNPAQEIAKFNYTAKGLLTSSTDPNGNTYNFEYDELGRLTSRTQPDGSFSLLERTRTEKGFQVSHITASGRESTYLTERLAPNIERQVNQGCGGSGAIVALTEADGKETINYPDGSIFIAEKQPELRFADTLTPFTKCSTFKTSTGKIAKVTTTRTVKLTNPDDPLSLETLTDTVDFNGRVSTTTYDAVNRQITYISPGGRQRISSFDEQGRVIQSQIPGLEPVQFSYSDRGELKSVQQGEQTILSYDYDNNGRLCRLRNAEGNEVSYIYDKAGRIIQSTLPSGKVNQFGYDANGNLTEIIVPSGAVHRLSYNTANLNLGSTNPEQGNTHNSYDWEQQPIHKVLPSGRVIKHSYDRDGDLEQVSYPEADVKITYVPKTEGFKLTRTATKSNQPQAITFGFEAILAPRLGLAETAIGHQNHQRDSQKLLLNTLIPDSGLEKSLTQQADDSLVLRNRVYREEDQEISAFPQKKPSFLTGALAQFGKFSYDRGLITEIHYSGLANGCYRYRYDENFFLVGVKLDENPETMLRRDADGLLMQLGDFQMERKGCYNLLTGISDRDLNVAIEYDRFGRTTNRTHTIKGQVVYQLSLYYDSLYRITQKQETAFGITTTYDYTYDCDGQLTQVKQNGVVVESYSYDNNSNRISWQVGKTNPQSAKYDAQDRIIELGNTVYQFDDDGFMTQCGSTSFEYSSRGELIKVIMPDGKMITYTYDGVGRRVARTSAEGTYQYLYGNPEKPLQVTAIREPSGTLSIYYYDELGLLFAIQQDEAWYYIATDQLGTPKVVWDAAGARVKVVEYDSFGNQTDDSNPNFIIPIGFAGGLTDWETKLVRFGFRDYDSASGRWTAKDPIGFAAGDSNLYRYVNWNPVNFVDRIGEENEYFKYNFNFLNQSNDFLQQYIKDNLKCESSIITKQPPNGESNQLNLKEEPLQIDWTFVAGRETQLDKNGKPIYITEGYVPNPQKSKSGVTVGIGFDIGQRNEHDLDRLDLPEGLKEKLRPYLKLEGEKAQGYLKKNPLSISVQEAELLYQKSKEDTLKKLEKSYNENSSGVKFRDLPKQAQTVITSVAFQYGDNLKKVTPLFWKQVTQQDWSAALKNLRNFGDDYRTRRNLEADYLEPIVKSKKTETKKD